MRMFVERAIGVLALVMASTAGAAGAGVPMATGLGQSWPNAVDVSASAHYHVYRFDRAGIRYVQVNDLGGAVRGAVAFVGTDILSLPIGTDAGRWITPTEGAWIPAAMLGSEPVYRDETMTVTAAPQPDGTVLLLAEPTNCDGNPAECSVPGP